MSIHSNVVQSSHFFRKNNTKIVSKIFNIRSMQHLCYYLEDIYTLQILQQQFKNRIFSQKATFVTFESTYVWMVFR